MERLFLDENEDVLNHSDKMINQNQTGHLDKLDEDNTGLELKNMNKSDTFEAILDQSCLENESFYLERLFQDENEDFLNQSDEVNDLIEKGISNCVISTNRHRFSSIDESSTFECVLDHLCLENESSYLERLFQDQNEGLINQSEEMIDPNQKGRSFFSISTNVLRLNDIDKLDPFEAMDQTEQLLLPLVDPIAQAYITGLSESDSIIDWAQIKTFLIQEAEILTRVLQKPFGLNPYSALMDIAKVENFSNCHSRIFIKLSKVDADDSETSDMLSDIIRLLLDVINASYKFLTRKPCIETLIKINEIKDSNKMIDLDSQIPQNQNFDTDWMQWIPRKIDP